MPTYRCAGGNTSRNGCYSCSNISKKHKVLWKHKTNDIVKRCPVVADGILFLITGNQTINAINALTGEELWILDHSEMIYSSPAYGDDLLFFNSRDSFIYAVHGKTGELCWKVELPTSTDCSPVVHDGVVYFGCANRFYALDSRTGEKKWINAESKIGSMNLAPVVSGNLVYAAGSRVGAFEIADGNLKWSYPSVGEICDWPVVANNIIILTISDWKGSYVALDASNGKTIWTREFNDNGAKIHPPAICENLVFCHDLEYKNHSLLALSIKTGDVVWKNEISNYWDLTITCAQPAVSSGIVYYSTTRGVVAVDTQSGNYLWMSGRKDIADFPPTISDGILYYWSQKEYSIIALVDRRRK